MTKLNPLAEKRAANAAYAARFPRRKRRERKKARKARVLARELEWLIRSRIERDDTWPLA